MTRSIRLFTPGPLNTSPGVRAAMNADMGSRTRAAVELTAALRAEIASIAACGPGHVVVPLLGSGTTAVEGMLTSLHPLEGRLLIAENGAYGQRMASICDVHGIPYGMLRGPHEHPLDLVAIETALERMPDVTHIAAVHFETALGVLNDADGLARLARRRGLKLLLDAVSTFGALPLDLGVGVHAGVALSANKCLHGVPGLAFVIAERDRLEFGRSPPRTLCLDLAAQWRGLEADGHWRFTPPLPAMLALHQALGEHREAGGVPARQARYAALADRLVTGFRALGIHPLIDASARAPMITTFAPIADVDLDVESLSDYLYEAGMAIYPTKHVNRRSFRVGCMGELTLGDIDRLVATVAGRLATASMT